jgi:hypothetical protein
MHYYEIRTRTQLANALGIHRGKLPEWLAVYDIILPKGLLHPRDVKMIFEKIGIPLS